MKRDLAVQYKSKEDAARAIKVLNEKDPSLMMSTCPHPVITDTGAVAFQCVDAMELDALRDIINETGGNILSINIY